MLCFHSSVNGDQPYFGIALRVKVKIKCTLVQALRLCRGRTAHSGSRGIALLFHDHGTRRGRGGSVTRWPSFTPGKTRYPLHRRLGGLHGRYGQVRKISPPPGFNPRTVQPVASRYTDYATRSCWTQRRMLFPYWRFGTTYLSHLRGLNSPKTLNCWTLEDGTDKLSLYVGTELQL
jgi:hypothetical protein